MLRIFLLALVTVATLLAGCGSSSEQKPKATGSTMCLYSELDNKFTQDLVDSFNKNNKEGLRLRFVGELKEGEPWPDLVLAEQQTLYGLKQQHKLQSSKLDLAAKLPAKLQDKEGYWYGVFYDPAVFLVNQTFARTIGQSSLNHDCTLNSLPLQFTAHIVGIINIAMEII